MALFRSERGIGRGEVAESQLEVPFLLALMVICTIAILVFNYYTQDSTMTLALAFCLVTFGITVVRVDFGIYILVTAIMLSPEVNLGQIGQHAERALTIRYDDLLIIIVFLGVLLKRAFEGKQMLWLPSPVNGAIFLYYFVCVMSFFMALSYSVPAWDRSTAFFVMLKMAEFYMIFIMVSSAVRDQAQAKRHIVWFFLVASIVCIYAASFIGSPHRLTAPFDAGGTEPNTLGGYLLVILSLSAGLFIHAPRRRHKLLLGLMFFIAFVPTVFTLSRASYLGIMAALVSLAIMSRRLYAAAFVAACFLLYFTPLMPEEMKDRIDYTFQREGEGKSVVMGNFDTGLNVDKSTYERIYVWRKVRYNLKVWPLLGGGPSWETVLDSQLARVTIETGLLGLGTFLFLWYRLLKTCRQTYRWSTHSWFGRGLALGMFCCTVGLIVHSMGTISFLIVRIMEPFWFLMGLTVIMRQDAILAHHQRVTSMQTEHDEIQEDSFSSDTSRNAAAV